MEFSGLYLLAYTAFNYYIFSALIAGLAGESKNKMKSDKVGSAIITHMMHLFPILFVPITSALCEN